MVINQARSRSIDLSEITLVRGPVLPGIRILRFDKTNGIVAVRYRVAANVWRLHHLPYDEFKALIDDDIAYPL